MKSPRRVPLLARPAVSVQFQGICHRTYEMVYLALRNRIQVTQSAGYTKSQRKRRLSAQPRFVFHENLKEDDVYSKRKPVKGRKFLLDMATFLSRKFPERAQEFAREVRSAISDSSPGTSRGAHRRSGTRGTPGTRKPNDPIQWLTRQLGRPADLNGVRGLGREQWGARPFARQPVAAPGHMQPLALPVVNEPAGPPQGGAGRGCHRSPIGKATQSSTYFASPGGTG